MLAKLMTHDRGMRVLIIYLFLIIVYSIVSNGMTLHQMIAPILESRNTPASTGDEMGFFTSSGGDASIWSMLAYVLPFMVVGFIPEVAGVTGLLLGRAWGWWWAGIHFMSAIIPGIPMTIFQLFFVKLPSGQSIYHLQPMLLVRVMVFLVVACFALGYLSRTTVRERSGVTGNTRARLAKLVGLTVLFNLLYVVPGLISMLF